MKKLIYTIVIIAPKNIQESLKEFKTKFVLPFNTSSIKHRYILKDTAHFAIKKTFFLKQGVTEKDLVKKIHELTPYKKIQINCSSSDIFSNTLYGEIIYAKINHNPDLIQLHLNIKQTIDNMIETKNLDMEGKKYIPHISMAYNVPKEKIIDAKHYLDTKILPFKFYMQRILLLREFDISKDERECIYMKNLI